MIKITNEICNKIAQECFTPEEKILLETTRGNIRISVLHELLDRYGDMYPLYLEEQMLRGAIRIIETNGDMLKKIKDYKDKYLDIIDPNNFQVVSNYEGFNYNAAEGSSNSRNYRDSASISSYNTVNTSSNINRNMTMEQQHISKNLDYIDDRDKLTVVDLKLKNISFTSDSNIDNPNLTIISTSIDAPNVKSIDDEQNSKIDDYNSQILNKNLDYTTNISNSANQIRDISDAKTSNESALCNLSSNVTTAGNKGEALEKMYALEIPNLKKRFWSCFRILFTSEEKQSPYYKPTKYCGTRVWEPFM